MIGGSAIDWTQVLVALVSVLPATVAAYFGYRIAAALRTPSGRRPGELLESTNDLSIVNTKMTQDIHKTVQNGREETNGGG